MCISGPITLSRPEALIGPCPAGSHVKTSITEDEHWADAAELCEAVSWAATWMQPICHALLPQLQDVEAMCATPPPTPPTIDLGQMAIDGTLYRLPNTLYDWLNAWWAQRNWADYCECNATTGPGPCPPVAQFGGPTTTQQFSAFTFLGRQPVGHNWLTMSGIARTTAGTQAGATSAYVLLEDASQTLLYTQNVFTMSAGGSQALLWSSTSINATIRANVRYVSFWGKCTTAATDTRTVTLEITGYTGPCTIDVTTTPPSPDPAPEPPQPDVPPLPYGPASCTIDYLCAQLYALGTRLDAVAKQVSVIQRFGVPLLYRLGAARSVSGGSTTWSVQQLAGIRVDITSAPPAKQLEGNPPYFWSQGWLTISAAGGMIDEKRLTRDTQIWQPERIQEATLVGVWLADGVTATVTELLPEAA